MCCLDMDDLEKLFNKNFIDNGIYKDLNYLFSDKFNLMRKAQLYYFKFYLPMILNKIDQASMFNSVECRSPFLSKKIINFSLDHDLSKLYKIFQKKYFIRKTFKNDIPQKILNRKKHGFAFPKELLLNDKKFIDNLIDHNLLINKDFFIKKYDNFLNKKEDSGQYVWNELILNLTLQNLNMSKILS